MLTYLIWTRICERVWFLLGTAVSENRLHCDAETALMTESVLAEAFLCCCYDLGKNTLLKKEEKRGGGGMGKKRRRKKQMKRYAVLALMLV